MTKQNLTYSVCNTIASRDGITYL